MISQPPASVKTSRNAECHDGTSANCSRSALSGLKCLEARRAWARAGGGAAQGGGVARQQADRVGVRRDDVVGADVHGVHDAAPLGGGAVLGRAGGGRGARPVGGG
eukprot:scaffold2656_cov64-Phaeocystis_antarctica.AAC.2